MTYLRNECIEHKQKGSRAGYGKTHYQGRQTTLHRVVYCKHKQLALADIERLVVRHTCDNPRCINPEHLTLGTYQDNMDDKVLRGRSARGESHGGVKLTEQDVHFIRANYKPRCRKYGTRALGRLFGVHNGRISSIVQGKSWGHI